MAAQKISKNAVALPEHEYKILCAASDESFAHWDKSQMYLHELTEARDQLNDASMPNKTIAALRKRLALVVRVNEILGACLGLVLAAAAFFFEVTR